MDNGNKIDIGNPEVKLFLQEDLLPSKIGAPNLYNLNEEYAKTRSKKMSFTIRVLFICVLVVALITFGAVMRIQSVNNNLEVDIAVFEELNLKNLLDVVSRIDNELKEVKNQKSQLEFELAGKIKNAEITRDTNIALLSHTSEDKEAHIEIITKEYSTQVKDLNIEYGPKITVYESKIEDLTKQLASFDSNNVQQAREQEAAINSQRKAFELEQERLIASYDERILSLNAEISRLQESQVTTQQESLTALGEQFDQERMAHQKALRKLDPVFDDERANALVSRITEPNPMVRGVSEEPQDFNIEQHGFSLEDEILQTAIEERLRVVDTDFKDFNYMADILSDVPWENSIKDYVKTLTTMANNFGSNLVSASTELFEVQDATIKDRENQIETITKENAAEVAGLENNIAYLESEKERLTQIVYEYQQVVDAVGERAKQNGEAGYILNIDDSENVIVYISPLYKLSVKTGTRAYVFRSSGKLVGMVSLYPKGSMIFAKPDEGVANNIRINDIILLELTQ